MSRKNYRALKKARAAKAFPTTATAPKTAPKKTTTKRAKKTTKKATTEDK